MHRKPLLAFALAVVVLATFARPPLRRGDGSLS